MWRERLRGVAQGVLLLAPPAALAWFGWQRRWVAEDAFIDLRTVVNLLAGYGPVYNPGERVEAFTSPLWVALLAGLARLAAVARPAWAADGLLEWIAALGGLVLAVAGLLAATLSALRLSRLRGDGGLALPLGALAVVAVPAYWDFATSGLETGLVLGWLGACQWSMVRSVATRSAVSPPRTSRIAAAAPGLPALGLQRPAKSIVPARVAAAGLRPPGSLAVATLLGLGPLIRPDLAIMSAGFLLVFLCAGTRGAAGTAARCAQIVRLLGVAAALPLAYQLFRMGYFAAAVPNTALAKEAGEARWDQGWLYLADFAGAYWLWIPAVPLLAWCLLVVLRDLRCRRWSAAAVVAVFMLCGALDAAYAVRVGGDFMHGRTLLPGVFLLLAPALVVAGRRWWHAAGPALVVVPWAAVCALWLRPPYDEQGNGVGPQGIAHERRFYTQLSGQAHPVTLADYRQAPWTIDGYALRGVAEQRRALLPQPEQRPAEIPAPTELTLAPWVPANVVANRQNIGLTGYAAGPRVHLVDRLGLADPLAARLRLARRGRPGHEKMLPEAWVIARFAGDPRPAGTAGGAEVQAAQEALQCGDVARLLAAVQAPLTPGRFVQNVGLAWRLDSLRLPADPVAARAEVCAAPPG